MTLRRLVAIVCAVGLIAALAAFRLAQGADAGSYTITAEVVQAPNLFAGGRVMVRGVPVGTITEVTPSADAVTITMEIDEGVRVPADATLSVIPITLIADRYVQLFPAYEDGPVLADGDRIPLERTSVPAELDEVLAELKGLIDTLNRAPGSKRGPLAELVTAADEALEGRSEALGRTIDNSAEVLGNLAASQTDINELIRNLDTLFVTLADHSSEIGLINERLALVTEALAGDQEHLEGTIENLTALSNQATLLIQESGEALGSSFRRLSRVLDTILANQKSLTLGVKWTNAIAQSLGEVNSSGAGKYAYTGKQAPVGGQGAEHNYRLDQRDTVACERIDAITESFLILNPNATVEQAAATILGFAPDVYVDDLTYLIESLIPFCSLLRGSEADAEARSVIRQVANEVGEKRFEAMLSRWFIQGYVPEDAP